MKQFVVALVAALAPAVAIATPGAAFAAGPPQHLTFSFDEPTEVSHVDSLGARCPDFVGTLVEERHLELDGWMKEDGTAHARTDVTAQVKLVPDDPQGVSYSGGYTQHQTGAFTAYGDDDRVVTTTTHGTIAGSDGSSYRISEVVHFSVAKDGAVHASFDRFRCEG
ncbi:MAG TPA: hypothetical protein VFJ12_14725 [Segeticoccus sp.]|nr:hypothetical protein [Segeticoccus sp.]